MSFKCKKILPGFSQESINVFLILKHFTKQFNDYSDILAFKETTWSYSKFVYHLNFFVWAFTAGFLARSNSLYNDDKYANGTMIETANENLRQGKNV